VTVSVPRAEFPPKEVEIVAYHLRNMMTRSGILNWLRSTYDLEIGSA
jgi:hypothetical protein